MKIQKLETASGIFYYSFVKTATNSEIFEILKKMANATKSLNVNLFVTKDDNFYTIPKAFTGTIEEYNTYKYDSTGIHVQIINNNYKAVCLVNDEIKHSSLDMPVFCVI